MAIVNKAIDVIKTLWPQRAIRPSMFTPGKSQNGAAWEWLHFVATYMGATPWSSTSARVMAKR
jgi:hypothetical protein